MRGLLIVLSNVIYAAIFVLLMIHIKEGLIAAVVYLLVFVMRMMDIEGAKIEERQELNNKL